MEVHVLTPTIFFARIQDIIFELDVFRLLALARFRLALLAFAFGAALGAMAMSAEATVRRVQRLAAQKRASAGKLFEPKELRTNDVWSVLHARRLIIE